MDKFLNKIFLPKIRLFFWVFKQNICLFSQCLSTRIRDSERLLIIVSSLSNLKFNNKKPRYFLRGSYTLAFLSYRLSRNVLSDNLFRHIFITALRTNASFENHCVSSWGQPFYLNGRNININYFYIK